MFARSSNTLSFKTQYISKPTGSPQPQAAAAAQTCPVLSSSDSTGLGFLLVLDPRPFALTDFLTAAVLTFPKLEQICFFDFVGQPEKKVSILDYNKRVTVTVNFTTFLKE